MPQRYLQHGENAVNGFLASVGGAIAFVVGDNLFITVGLPIIFFTLGKIVDVCVKLYFAKKYPQAVKDLLEK